MNPEPSNTRSKWWKRLGIALGSVFLLLVLLAAAIPFFVDVDTYRPQIVSAASEHLNGKLELGRLKLSLWGQVRVDVAGFSLSDVQGNKVVAAQDVFFHVPLLSIVTGAPQVTFALKAPELSVIKNKEGKLNIMTLMKAQPESVQQGTPSEGKSTLPSMVQNARMGLKITDARLEYKDQQKRESASLQDLDLTMEDISLTRPSKVEITGLVNSKMAGMQVQGPVRVTATGKPERQNGVFQKSDIRFKVDLSEMNMEMPDTFIKTKQIPAFAEGELSVNESQAQFKDLTLRFHNAIVKATGGIQNLSSTSEKPLTVDLSFKSQPVEVAPWKALILSLKPYELTGEFHLNGWARGPVDKTQYQVDFRLKGMSFSGAQLKSKPKLEVAALIENDRVSKMEMWMTAPGNELRISGNLHSFTTPRFAFKVNSTGMDLDALYAFPKSPSQAGAAPSAKPTSPESDLDALFDPMRKNEVARKASGTVDVQIEKLKAYEIPMQQIRAKMSMQNLALNIESSSLIVFDGKISAQSRVALAPKKPNYTFKMQASGINLQQAVASQFNPFKNTLVGSAHFQTSLQGESLNAEPMKQNLKGSGQMKIDNAVFNTIDIARVATEAINSALVAVGDKVPQLKGKSLDRPRDQKSEYETVTGEFTLAQGNFKAPNFFAKAKVNAGIDIKGNTEMSLVTHALRADWELIDTYNELRARDLSATIAGVSIPHILAKGNDPVRLPVHVEGTVFAPKVSYAAVPGALVAVALDNLKKAGEQKVKAEAQKVVKEKAGNLLKGLFKK